jgi:hypothetical protein
LALEESLLAPPAPLKFFRAAACAFLGGSAWVVVSVLEEDPDGGIKFSYPMSWLKDGFGKTVSGKRGKLEERPDWPAYMPILMQDLKLLGEGAQWPLD